MAVTIAGTEVSSLSTTDRAPFGRAHLGLVFQDADLLSELSWRGTFALAALFDRVARSGAAKLVRAALAEVGFEGFAGRRVDELSGGQAQRVALAKALVKPQADVARGGRTDRVPDAENATRITDLLIERTRSMRRSARSLPP